MVMIPLFISMFWGGGGSSCWTKELSVTIWGTSCCCGGGISGGGWSGSTSVGTGGSGSMGGILISIVFSTVFAWALTGPEL